MRKLIFLSLLMAYLPFAVIAGVPRSWEDDPEAAFKRAKREKKDMLILFTGTKWNNICKIFDREVVDNRYFRELAEKNFIVVYFDFGFDAKVSAKDAYIRNKCKEYYNVTVFPTVLVTDPNGKTRTVFRSYRSGSAGEFLSELAKYCKYKSDKFMRKFGDNNKKRSGQ